MARKLYYYKRDGACVLFLRGAHAASLEICGLTAVIDQSLVAY